MGMVSGKVSHAGEMIRLLMQGRKSVFCDSDLRAIQHESRDGYFIHNIHN